MATPLSSLNIRKATPSDAEGVLEIYAPYVESSVTSFEYEVPSVEEMRSRIQSTLVDFPFLIYDEVVGDTTKVGGYAYAGKHRVRKGYQWATETAVYIAPFCRGKGVGRLLYKELLEILKKQGYYIALAGVSGVNEASTNFHLKMGFEFEAKYRSLGYKLGEWIDVTWYSKVLMEQIPNSDPRSPVPYSLFKSNVRVNS